MGAAATRSRFHGRRKTPRCLFRDGTRGRGARDACRPGDDSPAPARCQTDVRGCDGADDGPDPDAADRVGSGRSAWLRPLGLAPVARRGATRMASFDAASRLARRRGQVPVGASRRRLTPSPGGAPSRVLGGWPALGAGTRGGGPSPAGPQHGYRTPAVRQPVILSEIRYRTPAVRQPVILSEIRYRTPAVRQPVILSDRRHCTRREPYVSVRAVAGPPEGPIGPGCRTNGRPGAPAAALTHASWPRTARLACNSVRGSARSGSGRAGKGSSREWSSREDLEPGGSRARGGRAGRRGVRRGAAPNVVSVPQLSSTMGSHRTPAGAFAPDACRCLRTGRLPVPSSRMLPVLSGEPGRADHGLRSDRGQDAPGRWPSRPARPCRRGHRRGHRRGQRRAAARSALGRAAPGPRSRR